MESGRFGQAQPVGRLNSSAQRPINLSVSSVPPAHHRRCLLRGKSRHVAATCGRRSRSGRPAGSGLRTRWRGCQACDSARRESLRPPSARQRASTTTRRAPCRPADLGHAHHRLGAGQIEQHRLGHDDYAVGSLDVHDHPRHQQRRQVPELAGAQRWRHREIDRASTQIASGRIGVGDRPSIAPCLPCSGVRLVRRRCARLGRPRASGVIIRVEQPATPKLGEHDATHAAKPIA
jgi:hypothetical protein